MPTLTTTTTSSASYDGDDAMHSLKWSLLESDVMQVGAPRVDHSAVTGTPPILSVLTPHSFLVHSFILIILIHLDIILINSDPSD